GNVTKFQCTDGSVCAGDRVECICTTSTGTIDWTISHRVLGSNNQSWIHVKTVNFNAATNGSTIESEGYTFTDNADKSSRLKFHLNASEGILIVCQDGNEGDNKTSIITDT
uniref:Ig-like domain-containing protein n=1 Tax=Amphimedon queenslandica TaxID=400682 RepID=A0A1X7SMZ1_AMPQE